MRAERSDLISLIRERDLRWRGIGSPGGSLVALGKLCLHYHLRRRENSYCFVKIIQRMNKKNRV